MIKIENISKYFNGTKVLEDISTYFERGKTNLIIGQSGSGKTVLLKCILGLFEASKGEIFFEKKLWPAFNEKDYNKILVKFKSIKRNFGNI